MAYVTYLCQPPSLHFNRPGDRFGASIALVGDCNHDGNPEIAVGAPLADASGHQVGEVYILELLPCTYEIPCPVEDHACALHRIQT